MRRMYSDKQIKEKALESINAEYDQDGKLNFHDPVVFDEDVKTDGKFEQGLPNWEADRTQLAWRHAKGEDFVFTNKFISLKIINNVLYIAGLVLLNNNTEESIGYSNANIEIDVSEMPIEYASKIIDSRGFPLNDATQHKTSSITSTVCYGTSDQSDPNPYGDMTSGFGYISISHTDHNYGEGFKPYLTITLFNHPAVAAGKSRLFTFRTFLVL